MIRTAVLLSLMALGTLKKEATTQLQDVRRWPTDSTTQIWGARFLTIHQIFMTPNGEYVEIDGFSSGPHEKIARYPLIVSRGCYDLIKDTIFQVQKMLPQDELAGVKLKSDCLGIFSTTMRSESLFHIVDSVTSLPKKPLFFIAIKGRWQNNLPYYIADIR